MSKQVEECLRKALLCERAAVLATIPDVRNTYRDLALQWREMAEQWKDLQRKNGEYQGPLASLRQARHALELQDEARRDHLFE